MTNKYEPNLSSTKLLFFFSDFRPALFSAETHLCMLASILFSDQHCDNNILRGVFTEPATGGIL